MRVAAAAHARGVVGEGFRVWEAGKQNTSVVTDRFSLIRVV